MSGIWTHVDNRFDRGTSSGPRQTIGSNQYNKPGSSSVNDPSSGSGSGSASFSSTSSTPPATHPPTRDMRTFSVRALFGNINASLTTSVPGKLSISFPSITRGFRAKSEPLPPKNEDVEMASPERIPRSRSEYTIRIPQDHSRDTPDEVEAAQEEEEEEVAMPVREPSPALTEACDPDSQHVIDIITAKGITVRDYAKAPPYADFSSIPNFPTDQSRAPKPVTEIFDQYKALTEIDYRWSQPERIYPVQGKTLRRLLDMRWLSEAELHTRGSAMDLEELEKFDSRPHYPWRPFRGTSSSPPSLAERQDMLKARTQMWRLIDRNREVMERKMESLLEEERKVALSNADFEALQRSREKGKGREMSPSNGTKRRFDGGDAEDEMDTTKDHELDAALENGSVPKKRRITPERATSFSQDPHPTLIAPSKQFPAALHAARIMEESSQPRPAVPERSDTPPLEENESQGRSPGKGTKLVHPRQQKAMKRALSRTQTFAQL